MLFPDDLRLALPDFYRNGLCLHSGSLEAQESHHGFPAVGVALVEHEVAEAVEYGAGVDVFHGLHDVWMVSYDGIRPGLHQFMGVMTLLYVGMGLEFCAPVQYGHDERRRMLCLVLSDSACKSVDGGTAYIRLTLCVLPVFKREEYGIEDGHLDSLFPDDGGGELLFHGISVAQRGNAGCMKGLVGVSQSLPPLVIGMVVGYGGVSDADLPEVFCPFGFSPEDEPFVERSGTGGQWAFQVDDHGIGLAENRGYVVEKPCRTSPFGHRPYAAVQQHVSCEQNGQ